MFGIEAVLSLYTGLPYDMKVWFQTGEWFNQGVNIYLPANHLGYPPLWALWCSIAYSAYCFFGSSLEIWRFVIKIPIMLAHVFLAYFVGRFAQIYAGKKIRYRIFFTVFTWGFIIFIGALWGQINTISALLTFLAFKALIDEKTTKSGLLLGTAVTLKIFPLVALPAFVAFAWMRKRKDAFKIVFWVITLPVTFTFLVFTIMRWDLLYFLKTAFYWTPVFESTQIQILGGGMNLWSFMALFKIDVGNLWFLRLLWLPILFGGFILFWHKKRKWKVPEFCLSLIVLYSLFIVSYGWATEQMFVDLLPFLFLQTLVFNPKKSHFRLFLVVQLLIFGFSAVNYGEFVFLPLLEKFVPSAESLMQILVPGTNPFVNSARAVIGLTITVSMLMLLIVLTDIIRRSPKQEMQRGGK